MRQLELLIERLSKSGDGVAEVEGRAVFVSGALPGERVLAEVEDEGKVLRGAVVRVLASSAARRSPACTLADRCGGCDWLHVDEATQLAQKEAIVVSTLAHLGGVESGQYRLLPTVASPAPLGYRRRATLHPADGALGFNGKRSHTRVPVASCPALTDPLRELPGRLGVALAPLLKDVEEVRLLECDGRVAVSVHLKAQARPRHRERLAAAIREGLVDGVVLAPGAGRGQVERLGEPVLEDDGVLHRPDGFAQANAAVNRRLVQAAVELLELRGGERVLELYSGNGNFTFRVAAHGAQVVAVESAALSVALAQEGARARGVQGVRFVQGDSEQIADGYVREQERFDRLLVDPPRTGAPGVGLWAARLLVTRVVYVACDPASLARDARALVAQGFQPLALQVFDLFPQTHHVEAVMAFTR